MMYEHAPQEDGEVDPYACSQFEQTQQASQSQHDIMDEWNESVWGILKPMHRSLARIHLTKERKAVTIGRASENDVILPNLKISNKHCILTYDPHQTMDSRVTVHDKSSNGTWINGHKIGRGRSAFLQDGSDIAFGQWSDKNLSDNYRYVFRFMANGPPEVGLHKYYDVGYELGRGSFATVKRAVCRADGRTYALKMINKNKLRAEGDGAIAIFKREVSILEQLRHPHICRLKETFFEDGTDVVLVLEYIDGGDLLDYIVNRDGLREDEARRLTFQLCKALKYIHAKGIAHRDLKPENILLTSDDPPVLKLADFGLAKAVDSMTRFKTMCGTPVYLAPEVILRDAQDSYSHVVDSWSTGVITFAMLANSTPFVDDDASAMAIRFRSRYVDWGLLDSKGVSPECRRFIKRLLEENPVERMTCADALKHPWLSPLAVNDPEALSDTPNDSLVSIRANAGSFFDDPVTTPQPSAPQPLPPVSAPGPLQVIPSTGISTDFEHIRMEDATPSPASATTAVPEQHPEPEAKQDALSMSRSQGGRKLQRHHMEVAERDEEGNLTSFHAFPKSPLGDISYVEESNDNSAGLKRKERSDSFAVIDPEHANGAQNDNNGAEEEGSLVKLTPVTENGDAADGDERLQNTNARKRAAESPAPQLDDPSARHGGPAKRTRATPADTAA